MLTIYNVKMKSCYKSKRFISMIYLQYNFVATLILIFRLHFYLRSVSWNHKRETELGFCSVYVIHKGVCNLFLFFSIFLNEVLFSSFGIRTFFFFLSNLTFYIRLSLFWSFQIFDVCFSYDLSLYIYDVIIYTEFQI